MRVRIPLADVVLPQGLRDRDARLPQPEGDAARNEAPAVDRSRSGCAVTLEHLAAEQPRLLILAVARARNHRYQTLSDSRSTWFEMGAKLSVSPENRRELGVQVKTRRSFVLGIRSQETGEKP